MAFRAVYRSNDPKWRKATGQPNFGEAFADFYNPSDGTVTYPSDGYGIPTSVYTIASGESFTKGALVRLNGSTQLTELTVVTQTVKGVALERVVNGSAQGIITTKACIVPVSIDNEESGRTERPRFAVKDKDNETPSSAHVGVKCAIYDNSGDWLIDIGDTANQDVEILDTIANTDEFVVVFLDAAIQA